MSFDLLIQGIEQQRQKAAAFYKVDLHIHSYESHDFPKLGDKEYSAKTLLPEDIENNPQHFIDFAKKVEDLRVIAITDHNLSRISTTIAKLSDAQITALPGMEVTLQATIFPDSKIHVLTIFPERCASEDIEKIFPFSCNMPLYDQRTKDSVAQITVDEFVKLVHDAGGICIAGHVNSDKGVRTLFKDYNIRQLETKLKIEKFKKNEAQGKLTLHQKAQLETLQEQVKKLEDEMQNRYLEFLTKHEFDAVEVQKSTDNQYYSGIHTDALGIKSLSCVIGSDAHNLQDIGLRNSTTYIKMQSPGFRDLRRALGDPATRIRYEDSGPHIKTPRILGVKFGGGFFKQHIIGFSDNLTCLIGGRGSGKSATIEALRYLFEHELSHLTKEKRADINNRRLHTLNGVAVEVLYADHNDEQFVLRRNYGTLKTECFDLTGQKQNEIDVALASNLDVKVFGWGEIEELARNKREQLRLIDGFIPDIQQLQESVRNALRLLEINTQEIINLAKNIQDLLPKIDELPQKESEFNRLSTPEVNVIFSEHDRNETAKSAIDSLTRSLTEISGRFQDDNTGKAFDILQELEGSLKNVSEKLNSYDWVSSFQETVRVNAQEIQQSYDLFIAKLNDLLVFISSKGQTLVEEGVRIEGNLNSTIEDKEGGDLQKKLARRRQLSSEVAHLRSIKDEIDHKRNKINDLMNYRNSTLLPDLENSRKVVTDTRLRKIDEINKRLEHLNAAVKVSLTLQPLEDKETFRLKLGAPDEKAPDGILKGVNRLYKKDDYAGHYVRKHTPSSFVRSIIEPGDYSSLIVTSEDANLAKDVIDLEKAKGVANHLSPYLEGTDNQFNAANLEKLLDLEHLDIEDLPVIKLDDKSIEDLSPGQRCSTLIPIILLESTSPLIIDQPEDNLDNELVFDLVVDILRSLKQQRQIIVATHNPNIPVSGDAEQIIVFETNSKKDCDVACQGSIDDETVIEKIKAIMEGSENAFRIRAEKYGYQLSVLP